jgi:HK97 family phage prohead protease
VSEFYLQGIATKNGECFFDKDGDILFLNYGCFDASIRSETEVKLLLDHDAKICLGTTTNDRLEVHAGSKGVAFRYSIPDSWSADFSDLADDFNSYLAVSIGFKDGNAELITVDGVKVTSVVEARLFEISILSKPPAIHSTYARVVSAETCGPLKHDYESGRLELIGKYIGIHRTFKATENGGVLKYNHTSSPYDRAALNFERTLKNLEYS